MSQRVLICRHCHKPEGEHCHFEELPVPLGCVCNLVEWGDDITPVCKTFNPTTYKGKEVESCQTCEHDKACHAK